jgi:hypothetical protein
MTLYGGNVRGKTAKTNFQNSPKQSPSSPHRTPLDLHHRERRIGSLMSHYLLCKFAAPCGPITGPVAPKSHGSFFARS